MQTFQRKHISPCNSVPLNISLKRQQTSLILLNIDSAESPNNKPPASILPRTSHVMLSYNYIRSLSLRRHCLHYAVLMKRQVKLHLCVLLWSVDVLFFHHFFSCLFVSLLLFLLCCRLIFVFDLIFYSWQSRWYFFVTNLVFHRKKKFYRRKLKLH